MIIEVEFVLSGEGKSIFMYFLKTADVSVDLFKVIPAQNPSFFPVIPDDVKITREFSSLEDADAHVKKHSHDEWNQKDVYFWPVQKIEQLN